MIKLLKLQKAVFVLILGVLSYIAYKVLEAYEVNHARYLQMLAGILVMVGALWMLYPIIFAKKDDSGNAEIITDPTVEVPVDGEEEKSEPE
ncbi:isoleucyl-tRNA synthetase [Pedobacter endophyticus]|uniref:Isoleucyl-tRNA synthetase n=1 Tax=Pedobacter endophyticus TaxID=2789740 RepID=A0A7U3Q5B2_9SPHI|nr:isoleucyl-tRNA synthetase [Pedobacter endophyticus]QPH38579.1 isoleucyl-tRNA synthetase [Pedobacter endophyticus]